MNSALRQRLFLETLAGHLALLETHHPRKAASQCSKRAKRYVESHLRTCTNTRRRLAA